MLEAALFNVSRADDSSAGVEQGRTGHLVGEEVAKAGGQVQDRLVGIGTVHKHINDTPMPNLHGVDMCL